jgi:hypothetical protein
MQGAVVPERAGRLPHRLMPTPAGRVRRTVCLDPVRERFGHSGSLITVPAECLA